MDFQSISEYEAAKSLHDSSFQKLLTIIRERNEPLASIMDVLGSLKSQGDTRTIICALETGTKAK